MNPAERTQVALLAKAEQLCNAITDIRNPDPWGGSGYMSTIVRAVKMEEASDYGPDGPTKIEGAYDYATSAHKELLIKEQTAGLIRTAQEISTLIRDLQELWLFGGLDTLLDPADEEAARIKALAVAQMIEALASHKTMGKKDDETPGPEMNDAKDDTKNDAKDDTKNDAKNDTKNDAKNDAGNDQGNDTINDTMNDTTNETKSETKNEDGS